MIGICAICGREEDLEDDVCEACINNEIEWEHEDD